MKTIEMSHGTVCSKCLLWPDLCTCELLAAGTLERTYVGIVAAKLWASFDDNEKTGVRFGMFPAGPMQVATEAETHQPEPVRDFQHKLVCALMDEVYAAHVVVKS